MALFEKRYWGKVLGAFLGFSIAGPFGAVIGFLIGHAYDRQAINTRMPLSSLWDNYHDFAARAEQGVFTMGVIVLSAKMAKSDGRVTRAEIEAFKRVFRISPAQEDAVGRLFDRARLSADGFEPYATQLAQVFRGKPAVLEEILTGLFIIATADSSLKNAESDFLKHVAFLFGFDAIAFHRIAARAGVHIHNAEQGDQRPRDETKEAFAILGVSEVDSSVQIKSAYRALIREHHPDKLLAQGMPPEFVATATEKMKRINVAYDTVCKIKGIK